MENQTGGVKRRIEKCLVPLDHLRGYHSSGDCYNALLLASRFLVTDDVIVEYGFHANDSWWKRRREAWNKNWGARTASTLQRRYESISVCTPPRTHYAFYVYGNNTVRRIVYQPPVNGSNWKQCKIKTRIYNLMEFAEASLYHCLQKITYWVRSSSLQKAIKLSYEPWSINQLTTAWNTASQDHFQSYFSKKNIIYFSQARMTQLKAN